MGQTEIEQCEVWGLVARSLDGVDMRVQRVMFTATGLDWLAAFERAVG